MLILSLNVRGLGGKTKLCSLHSLFFAIRLDMILLQETMCISYPALHEFSKLFPNWEFCATSAFGLLGGPLTAWDPHKVRCWDFETAAGILVKAIFYSMNDPFDILNCYGPYLDQVFFWERVLRGGLLNSPNVILGGDLNLTLNASETWESVQSLILSPHISRSSLISWDILMLPLLAQVPLGETVELGMRVSARDLIDS